MDKIIPDSGWTHASWMNHPHKEELLELIDWVVSCQLCELPQDIYALMRSKSVIPVDSHQRQSRLYDALRACGKRP